MSAVQLLLASAPVTVLTPLVLRDLGEPGSTYGLVLSVGAVGGLLGALVAARWRPERPGVAGLAALSFYAVTPVVAVPHPDVHLPTAAALYGDEVSAVQLVWADPDGRWPWDPGHGGGSGGQPVVGPREPLRCGHLPEP